MRKAYIVIFVFSILISIASYFILPDKVAIHFGFKGRPDSWASKEVNLIATVVIQLVVFIILYSLSFIVFVIPVEYTNMPNKDYWIRPENLPVLKQKIQSNMMLFSIASFLMLNIVFIVATVANLSDPVQFKESACFTGLGIYLAFMVFWIVRFYMSFRLPKSTNSSTN